MKEVLTALALSLCLNFYMSAQTKVDTTQSPDKLNETPKAATPRTSELVEANRLSAQIVKLYREQKYDEALPLAKREVELREKVLGAEHQTVAVALFNFASIYLATKRYREAELLFKRSLMINEKAFGTDSLKLYPMLESYAFALFGDGKYVDAEKQLKRAVEIREDILGDESIDVARARYKLGSLFQALRNHGQALGSYDEAAAISRKLLNLDISGADNPTAFSICADLTKARQKETLDLLEQAGKVSMKQTASAKDAKDTPDKSNAVVAKRGVLNGRALSLPRPDYPPAAKSARVGGNVIVKVFLDETGRVTKAEPLCGPSLLSGTAVNAAKQARFAPTLLFGVPVKASGTITYNFLPY